MERPEEFERRLTKTVKFSVTMSEEMRDYIDSIAEASEVSRSEVIQWVFTALMEDFELASEIFGWDVEKALEEDGEEEEEDLEEEEDEEEEEED